MFDSDVVIHSAEFDSLLCCLECNTHFTGKWGTGTFTTGVSLIPRMRHLLSHHLIAQS